MGQGGDPPTPHRVRLTVIYLFFAFPAQLKEIGFSINEPKLLNLCFNFGQKNLIAASNYNVDLST